MCQQIDGNRRRAGQSLRDAGAGEYPRRRVHTAQGGRNGSEFDVLLRHVRQGTDEITRTMAMVAAGGLLGGLDVLPGQGASLEEGSLVVGVGLNRNQE